MVSLGGKEIEKVAFWDVYKILKFELAIQIDSYGSIQILFQLRIRNPAIMTFLDIDNPNLYLQHLSTSTMCPNLIQCGNNYAAAAFPNFNRKLRGCHYTDWDEQPSNLMNYGTLPSLEILGTYDSRVTVRTELLQKWTSAQY